MMIFSQVVCNNSETDNPTVFLCSTDQSNHKASAAVIEVVPEKVCQNGCE